LAKPIVQEPSAGRKVNLRDDEELDPASAKSARLADAYDLNARIETAMGKLNPALRDLDAAVGALPKNPKAAPREATYYYHQALILADNSRFADAAKSCQRSLEVKISDSRPDQRRKLQCLEIYVLASDPAAGELNDDLLRADYEQEGSVQAQIERIARSNNYSPFPVLTVSLTDSAGAGVSRWVFENGTQYALRALMSRPSEQRIELAPGRSTSFSLLPGTYRIAVLLEIRSLVSRLALLCAIVLHLRLDHDPGQIEHRHGQVATGDTCWRIV